MFIYKSAATAEVASIWLASSLLYLLSVKKYRNLVPRILKKYGSAVMVGIIFDIIPMFVVGTNYASGIAAFFGKNITFNGRAEIWLRSFTYIISHPITGIGIESDEMTALKIGINHCHNFVLEHLYRGGIIALGLFLLVMWEYRPRKPQRIKAAIFSASIISYFITASMDWYYYYPLPLSMLVFNYHANKY